MRCLLSPVWALPLPRGQDPGRCQEWSEGLGGVPSTGSLALWVQRKHREGRSGDRKDRVGAPVATAEALGGREQGPRPWPDPSPVPQHQIVQYLRDMFDLDNVRYTSVPALADDILQLSRRRSEILLGYLGVPVAGSLSLNGVLPQENGPLEELQ